MNTKEQRFSKLVKEHEQTIYAVCYMFSHDAEDVDDLHQEILLRLWQGYDGFEGRSDIKTWIYRVALNYCINFSDKRKREQTRRTTARESDTSDSDLEKQMQIKQLYQRINKLGLVDRSVILLWLEGLSYEEIGAILGISVKNVSFKLVRIKERLKND
ncbi:MAG TPA: sigma-70 family RNA polymerase sigma factor [Candidatus Alistipes avicola]|uniref:Sigma-70 family RNA polymerase sigma factor n=1 Tax=Candidatus Alistipes avicola TaxID=2838432 RepID=A0A9D2L4I3_9BACT|nr:sigma-70 family RNA polymerase sigma factor [uncultured Alistipes sp.]HJA99141.1 sigma-70 family RNA polymerase sigma factor [Candidatus Alistipes avicola]